MDMALIIFAVFSRFVQGFEVNDYQSLCLSELSTSWRNATNICRNVAGEAVFCSGNGDCQPKIQSAYNGSELPRSFTAWIDSFLEEGFTFAYKGCYRIDQRAETNHVMKQQPNMTDLQSCVLSCDFSFDFVGWKNNMCYCVMDSVVTVVSTAFELLPTDNCSENTSTKTDDGFVMNLFQKFRYTDLTVDQCPIAYNLGGGYVNIIGQENCESSRPYHCRNTSIESGKSSWETAKTKCSNESSELMNDQELLDFFKHSSHQGRSWIDGFYRYKLKFNGTMVVNTRCVALKRDTSGKTTFIVLDCSSQLPVLCVRDNVYSSTASALTVDDTSIATTTESDITSPTDSVQNTVTCTSSSVVTSTDASTVTSAVKTVPEQNKTKNNTGADEGEKSNTVEIAVGVVVFLILAVAIFIFYFRKRKQAFQRSRRINRNQFRAAGTPNDAIQTQAMRYLPSTITMPSDSNFITPNDMSEIEKSNGLTTSLHFENDNENGDAHSDDVEVFPAEIESQTNQVTNSDQAPLLPLKENERSSNKVNINQSGLFPTNGTEAASDSSSEDRYVSIHVPEVSHPNDVIEKQNTLETKDSTSLKTDIFTDDRSHAIGHDSTQDVDISTLRDLIEDDTSDQGIPAEIIRDSIKGERIDSAVFRD